MQYEDELTPFEMTELNAYDFIYSIGSVRIHSTRQVTNRDGFYKAQVGE